MLKIIAGLGNWGDKYALTRHNVGFWFLDALLKKSDGLWKDERGFEGQVAKVMLHGEAVLLFRTKKFMNTCGLGLAKLARFYKISPEDVLIVHDEVDFAAGVARLKLGGSHGGHNGLRDCIRHLGSSDFARLRIGIGHPGDSKKVHSYVLSKPSTGDRISIDQAMDNSLSVLPDVIRQAYEPAMNQLHSQRSTSEL